MHTKIKTYVDKARKALESHDVYKATELVYHARCLNETTGSYFDEYMDLLKIENEIINIWTNDLKVSELFADYKPQRNMFGADYFSAGKGV